MNLSGVGPGDFDCSGILAKYPVESYEDQKSRLEKGGKSGSGPGEYQAHHVISNAHFSYPRMTAITEICPGYSHDKAPCIPLEDGRSTSFAHGHVSSMQSANDTSARQAFNKDGTRPSYSDARGNAKKQLTSPKPGPAMTDEEAECVLKAVDAKFREMCPDGMKDQGAFKLRPPGISGTGLSHSPSGVPFG